MRAHDQRFGNRPQPPASRDARDLTRGILAVAAGADECRIGPAVDAIQRRVVSAVPWETTELPRLEAG